MKQKVSLKEMVGTKIIYAALLGFYYWMWARRDWHDWYTVIQHTVIVFTILFFAMQAGRIHKYTKEEKNEAGIQTLRRIDAILLKMLAAADSIIAFMCAVAFIDGRMAGYALVGSIFVLTVVRFVLFCVMDGKKA